MGKVEAVEMESEMGKIGPESVGRKEEREHEEETEGRRQGRDEPTLFADDGLAGGIKSDSVLKLGSRRSTLGLLLELAIASEI